MPMKRRAFLKGVGVLTILVAGGVVWRAYDQGVFSIGQGPAYEPWKNWRMESSPKSLALVRAAILAANPHNTQPWWFKVEERRIELYADTVRNLGSFDPYLREMHLGLGCAVENPAPLRLAAPTGRRYGVAQRGAGAKRGRRGGRKEGVAGLWARGGDAKMRL